MAAAGVAEANRELVSDESAAMTGVAGGRLVKHARYLLASAGKRTSESAEVQGDAGPWRALLPVRAG